MGPLKPARYHATWAVMTWLLGACDTSGAITVRDPAACTAPAPGGREPLRVRPSGSYLDSLGLQVDLSLPGMPPPERVVADLQRIGARHIFIAADTIPRASALEGYVALGSAGMRLLVGLYVGADPFAIWSMLGSSVEGFQAPSPGDGSSGSPPLEDTRANVELVAKQLAAPRAAGELFVLGPQLFNEPVVVGDLTPWVDFGHTSAARLPGRSGQGQRRTRDSLAAYGQKPRMAIGGGVYRSGGADALSENVQARYLARLFLDFFDAGIVRTFQALYDTDARNVGMFGDGGTTKAAGRLFENMATLLDGVSQSTIAGLPIALDATDADPVQRVLLRNADGSFVLFYWREIESQEAEQVRTAQVNSKLPMTNIREHTLTSNAPAISHADGMSVTIVASDAPRALTFRIECR